MDLATSKTMSRGVISPAVMPLRKAAMVEEASIEKIELRAAAAVEWLLDHLGDLDLVGDTFRRVGQRLLLGEARPGLIRP